MPSLQNDVILPKKLAVLKSHLSQLQETIHSDESVGRKLDFIIQEMFRETNTMCSKANDSVMLKDLVDVKTEIEKIQGTDISTSNKVCSRLSEIFRVTQLPIIGWERS